MTDLIVVRARVGRLLHHDILAPMHAEGSADGRGTESLDEIGRGWAGPEVILVRPTTPEVLRCIAAETNWASSVGTIRRGRLKRHLGR